MNELEQRLAKALNWPKGYEIGPREARIIAHYEQQIARSRENLNVATDRAVGDIKGQNRHPKRKQR